MKKRMISILTAAVVMTAAILAGCGANIEENQKNRYQATFLTLFDTVTTIVGYADSEEAFKEAAQKIHDELLEYHQLFDIYNEYEGINNIKTINDQAGIAPVTVDRRIIDLLLESREFYEATDGKINVAMGSVLSLWHDVREEGIDDPENAQLPDMEALKEAALHTSFDTVVIDEAASTVYLSDAAQSLDVGAIAKGWSVEQVCENAPSGLLVSVGGNVCATGPKPENDTPWVVGIQDPDDQDAYLHTIYLSKGSVVTSGDYQRYYMVDGKIYHHIIDPDTLFPAAYWQSVSIVCEDSGVADALSTALFVLPMEEGLALLEEYDACAMWVDLDGEIYYSPGFEELIRT